MLLWVFMVLALLANPMLSLAQWEFRTVDSVPGARSTEVVGVVAGKPSGIYLDAVTSQFHGFTLSCAGEPSPLYTLAIRASNGAGHVGWYLGPSGRRTGWRVQGHAFLTVEGPFDAQHQRPLATDVLHINSAGIAVGSYQSADGVTHGLRYDPAVATTTHDVPSTSATEIIHIADDDRLLARALGLDDVVRYYLWDSGTWTLLTLPPLPNVEIVSRTATGALVGNTDTTAFRWDGTTVETLAVPAATRTTVLGSQDVSLFGRYTDSAGAIRGFVATPTGTPDPCDTARKGGKPEEKQPKRSR